MKVKKILCKELHVGMIIVDGTKENHTLHKITEVWLRPREGEGFFKIEGRQAMVPFKLDEAHIRVVNNECE